MASAQFRAGVVAIVTNSSGDVMCFERIDVPGAWQLPQGGIDAGERTVDAAWRELGEETALTADDVELIGEFPEWTLYEWPATIERTSNSVRSNRARLGQAQRWFWFRVRHDDVEPRPDGVEFGAWRWWRPTDIIDAVVDFRQPSYRRVLTAGPEAAVASAQSTAAESATTTDT